MKVLFTSSDRKAGKVIKKTELYILTSLLTESIIFIINYNFFPMDQAYLIETKITKKNRNKKLHKKYIILSQKVKLIAKRISKHNIYNFAW